MEEHINEIQKPIKTSLIEPIIDFTKMEASIELYKLQMEWYWNTLLDVTRVPKRYLQDKSSALDLLIYETEENFQNTMNKSNQNKWNLDYNATYLNYKMY